MNISDIFVICRCSMARLTLCRFLPCRHLFHQSCVQDLLEQNCPNCRSTVTNSETVTHKKYKTYSDADGERIVTCAEEYKYLLLLFEFKCNYNFIMYLRMEIGKSSMSL